MGLLWDKWMPNTTFMLQGARTVTAKWFIWCMMIFTFHVTHPEPYCEIRGSAAAAAAADNCATWLKAYNSVRSQRRDGAGVQFFSRRSPCGQSPRAVGHCISLVASGAAVHTRKKNDTDYGRFMRVINMSSLMSLRTAFQPLLGPASEWLMGGLFVPLVHSLSCLCSVSHPRCRSTFTIQMTLTASAPPSRNGASSRPWPSFLRYGIIKHEG